MKKRKSTLMTQPWRLINCNWGVQICEGNRVIVAISEPESKDQGPRRTQDVMERANLLLAAPLMLAALEAIQEAFVNGEIKFTKVRQADSDPYHPANVKLAVAIAAARGEV